MPVDKEVPGKVGNSYSPSICPSRACQNIWLPQLNQNKSLETSEYLLFTLMTRLGAAWDLGCLVNYNIDDISSSVLREGCQSSARPQQRDTPGSEYRAALGELTSFVVDFAVWKPCLCREMIWSRAAVWSSVSPLLRAAAPSVIPGLLQKDLLETTGLIDSQRNSLLESTKMALYPFILSLI